ncbi:MAG: phosphatase PAP2 family protein [Phycisphaerales bacterium]|nr:phosphatase PAP2 family protein [Phycisphaerales bacterium]
MTRRAGFNLTILGAVAFAMVIAVALDPIVVGIARRVDVREGDLYRLARIAGYLPSWIAVAVCLVLIDRRQRIPAWWDRGAMVVLSVLATGAGAEVIKLIVRRERPENAMAEGLMYAFRSFADHPLSSSGIGFPSSHAAVAFGGAFMVARVAPAVWPVVVLWAIGCAVTRVLSGAHYLSDTVGAAVVGYACSTLLWSMHRRHAARAGVPGQI